MRERTGNMQPMMDWEEHAEVNGVAAKKVVVLDENGDQAQLGTSVFATIMEESGTTIYLAEAPAGSDTTDAVWRVQKIDTSSGVTVTWADGNSNFDNQADDLSALTYS